MAGLNFGFCFAFSDTPTLSLIFSYKIILIYYYRVLLVNTRYKS